MRLTNLPFRVQKLFNTHQINLNHLGYQIEKIYFRYVRNSKRVPKGIILSIIKNGELKTFSSKVHKDDTFDKYDGFVVIIQKMLGVIENVNAESIMKDVTETEGYAKEYFGIKDEEPISDEYRSIIDAMKAKVNGPKPKNKEDITKFLTTVGDDGEEVPVIDGEVKSFIGVVKIGSDYHSIYDYDLVVEHIMEMFGINTDYAIDIVEKSIVEFNKSPKNPLLVKTYK